MLLIFPIFPCPFWSWNTTDCSFSSPPPSPFFFFTSFLNHKQSISVSYYSMVYFPRDTIQLFISSLSSQNEHAQRMNIYKMYPRGWYYQWIVGTWGETVPKHQGRCWWANMANMELPMPWLLAMDLLKIGWPWPQGHQDHLQANLTGEIWLSPRTVLEKAEKVQLTNGGEALNSHWLVCHWELCWMSEINTSSKKQKRAQWGMEDILLKIT